MTKKHLKRILSVMLVGIIISTYAVNARGTINDDINSSKDKVNSYQQQIDATNKKLEELSKQSADAENYIKQLDAQVAEMDARLYEINNQLESKQAEITENEELLAQSLEEQQRQYEAMKLRIKYMYEKNSTSYLEILLSSQDMADLLNKAEYINQITDYDRSMLEYMADIQHTIENTKVQLEDDYASLEAMKNDALAQKDSIELMQQAKLAEQENLNKLTSDASSYKASIEKAKAAEEKQMADMIAEAKRQEEAAKNNTTISVPKYDGGVFKWPTNSTRITSAYGDTEDRGAPHKGVDIGAVKPGVSGDPIYAAYDGVVTLAAYSSSAGNWITINHGNGLFTVYMHCSKLLVSSGQKVSKGDTIGLMGTTGNSTGVHLHFGVSLNGTYVNPMPYFNK